MELAPKCAFRHPLSPFEGVPGNPGRSQNGGQIFRCPQTTRGSTWPFLWLFPELPGTPPNLYKTLCKALKAFTSLLSGPKKIFEAFKWRLKALRLEGVPGNIVESHNEVQEDLVGSVGSAPQSFLNFKVCWSSWPSFWLFPGLSGTPSNFYKAFLHGFKSLHKSFDRPLKDP